MAKPYSADLRERVLAASERGEASRAAVAQRFSVSAATLYNWLRQAREEGRREAKPHAGGPAPKVDADGQAVIRTLWSRRTTPPRSPSMSRATPRARASGSAWG